MYTLNAPVLAFPDVVGIQADLPALPEGVQDFVDEVRAQPLDTWFPAPLSKKGERLRGDTAAGQAVETFLKIAVNNSDGPDIPKGRIEVKAGRETSECPTTMLTLAPDKPEGTKRGKSVNRQMVETYGYQCSEDENTRRLMIRVSAVSDFKTRDGHAFSLTTGEENFSITANGVPVASYGWERFMGRAEKKIGGVLAHFEAESRPSEEFGEEFRIKSLHLYWGYDADRLRNSICEGVMMVEPRLKLDTVTNKVRDRGTGFRLNDPKSLYRYALRIV